MSEDHSAALKAACAEAGYPNAYVDSYGGGSITINGEHGVPAEVCWRAHAVVHPESTACWPCWIADEGETCTHDPRTEPWPAAVAPAGGVGTPEGHDTNKGDDTP